MSQNVELATFDLRYEGHRLRHDARESRLLASIALRGVEEPVAGVDTPEGRLLLDGFKRYRCARKLNLDELPYVSLGREEADGIVSLMRVSTDQALSILEQARFVVDLLTIHELSLADVAETLSRSKGWVSMRRTLLEGMSEGTRQILFRGDFPVYSYMYTLRPFRRMNAVSAEQIDRFIGAVSGKRLSVRDIERLAQGYFRGPTALREAIEGGKLGWSLEQMKQVPEDAAGCSDFERLLLKDFELLGKYLERVTAKCHDPRLKSRAFFAQANLLAGGFLSHWEPFQASMKEFYDRSGRP